MTIVHDPVVIVYLHRWYSEIPQFCIQLYITGNHVSNIALFRLLELKIMAHAFALRFSVIFSLLRRCNSEGRLGYRNVHY